MASTGAPVRHQALGGSFVFGREPDPGRGRRIEAEQRRQLLDPMVRIVPFAGDHPSTRRHQIGDRRGA
jgi:hypothetical protein